MYQTQLMEMAQGYFESLGVRKFIEYLKSFFPTPVKKTHDEYWTRNEIYKALHRNGNIIERARRRGESLDYVEGMIISAVRGLAVERGFSKEMWQALEMEGERNLDEVFKPLKVVAKFAFYNFGEHPNNPMPDFHVIESNHPALAQGGNYSLLDFERTMVKPPKYPSYEKWVNQGRPIFRG